MNTKLIIAEMNEVNKKILLIGFTAVLLTVMVMLPKFRSVLPITQSSINRCTGLNEGHEKMQCLENLVDDTLENKGLGASFDLIANLYDRDADFAADCHGFTHKLGEKAYELFSNNKYFALSSKSNYCGYGFYHGFMEVLLQATSDMSEARRFCEYVDQKLASVTVDAKGACYHGIGHGAVDGGDPRAFGNPQAMIAPSLDLCELVSGGKDNLLFRCATGSFNALEIFMSSKKYNLTINKDNPFDICEKQIDRYKKACYTQMVVALLNVTRNDSNKSTKIISEIEEDEYAIPTLEGIVIEKVRLEQTDYQNLIDYCRGIEKRFHYPCITAFAEGFMKYGPPQREYIDALKFCSSDLLTGEERESCYWRILSTLRNWYTREKAETICKSVPQEHNKRGCIYN